MHNQIMDADTLVQESLTERLDRIKDGFAVARYLAHQARHNADAAIQTYKQL